jgi:peptidoglycan/LPS O-acetylase OafA/YrhL
MATTHPKKSHLYEVDFMRLFFICGVLFNHTLNIFTSAMHDQTAGPYYSMRSIRVMFHYTRMGFLLMSALVLTLNYYQRHDWPRFFKKRFNGSLWPYLIWNLLFLGLTTWSTHTDFALHVFGRQYLSAVIHGNQSYMYFMLLIMQLYLFFPLLVALFKKFPTHHNRILIISFAIQLFETAIIKYQFQLLDTSTWWYWFKAYSVNVFVYQFYFIAGTYTCLHYQTVAHLIKQHIKPLFGACLVLGIGSIFYYRILDLALLHESNAAATSLHQPYTCIYSICMIGLVFWIGQQYAQWRQQDLSGWLDHLIQLGAKISFGIYLNQIIGLTLLKYLLRRLALSDWQLLIGIPVGYLVVLSVSFLLAWFCYRVYPLGILVGRPQKRHPIAA